MTALPAVPGSTAAAARRRVLFATRLYTDMDRQFRYGLDLMLTGLGLRTSAAW